jgi:transposase
VINLAPGTKVFLACRPVDLRNGFDGLAAKAQQMIGADPFSGHLFTFAASAVIISRVCIGTAAGCACSPSDWRRAALCGRRSSMAA